MDKKRKHHYVWQNYLKAFCDSNEMLYCLLGNKIKHLPTSKVGVKKDLYKILEMSVEEVSYLRSLFKDDNDPVRNHMNQHWITLFTTVHNIKLQYPKDDIPEDIASEINLVEYNMSENSHMDIENKAIPYIASLQEKNLSFLDNLDDRANFLLFLFIQYARTLKFNNQFALNNYDNNIDIIKAWNIIVYIVGSNLCLSIYRKYDQWEFKLLINNNTRPFITGDQPIINLFSYKTSENPVALGKNDFEIYYPISPFIGLILKQKGTDGTYNYSNVDNSLVTNLNQCIVEASDSQIYSNSENCLKDISLIKNLNTR